MIIECCSQEKTFVRYYALLGARFCMLRKEFQVGWGALGARGRGTCSVPCTCWFGGTTRIVGG